MRRRSLLLYPFILLCAFLLQTTTGSGQIPRLISYQGLATGDGGMLLTGTHEFTIRFYDSPTSNTPIYSQTTNVTVVEGIFNIEIGPISPTITFDRQYFMTVSIDGGPEPEIRDALTSSPYALNAERSATALHAITADTALVARGLAANATGVVTSLNGASGPLTIRGAGGTRISISGTTITISSDTTAGVSSGNSWSLSGNAGTNPGEDFLGTLDNRPFEIHVNDDGHNNSPSSGSGRVVRYEAGTNSPNIIAGFNGNVRSGNFNGIVIAGGGAQGEVNQTSANYTTIGGGKGNRTKDVGATVAGGTGNSADGQSSTVAGGQDNQAASIATTVAGGIGNRAMAWNSTVSGGKTNTAQGVSSTISGGEQNSIFGIAGTIGGGAANLIAHNYGTIAGGDGNATSREYTTIGGGRFNNASADGATVGGGYTDTASGDYATVGGGIGNKASTFYATVSGGQANKASGRSSTIAGGTLNVVKGDYSTVAGGYGLTIESKGSFGFLSGDPTSNRQMILGTNGTALFGNANLMIGNNDGKARALQLYEPYATTGVFPGLNTNYSSFETGDQNANYEYILPLTLGNVGDVLSISSINGKRVQLSWSGRAASTTSGETGEPASEISTGELLEELRQKTAELEKTQQMLQQAIERLEQVQEERLSVEN